ncbi:MAG: methyltransferase domain-containing protein [Blastocatellia bacterium]|nr:methyltransferase domain-containing protein [Blastocatellia bacterium]
MSTREYHLGELAIARSAGDSRRIMPPLPPGMRSILDLGCGAGQTLLSSNLASNVVAFGLDIDEEALKLGRELTKNIHFVKGSGERLPFDDQTFDVVISRVAIPYTEIPVALKEIFRVLRPNGQIWLTLHSLTLLRQWMLQAFRQGNLRAIAYHFYICLNSLLFHLNGRVFRYPLNRVRCESVQTSRGMRQAMKEAGFDRIEIENQEFFVARGIKP